MGHSEKLIFIIVIVAVIAGVFFRFNEPLSNVPNDDEAYNFIAAVKLNTPHDNYDPRLFNYEHPFLGKKIMGLLVDPNRNYHNTRAIASNDYSHIYLTASEIKTQEWGFRLMTALFGILFLIPVFLLARKMYNTSAALISVALVAIGVGFINLSRITFQDAFLPFFLTFAIYFGYQYYAQKETNENKFSKWIFLMYFFIFITASLLVRMGQPIIISIAILFAFRNQLPKFRWIFLVLILSAVVFYFGYGSEAFDSMQTLRGERFVPLSINTQFIAGLFSQQSIAFGIFALAGIILLLLKKTISLPVKWKKIREWYGKLQKSDRFVLDLLIISVIGMLFSDAGSLPRFYLIFSLFPIIFVSQFIANRIQIDKRIAYCFAFIVILDILLLISVNPFFTSYSVAGMKPAYIENQGIALDFFKNKLNETGIEYYFTNDATLLLRDEKAKPFPPPKYFPFNERELCTPVFFEKLEWYFLVYNSNEELLANDRICGEIRKHEIQFIAALPSNENPVYQIYGVHVEKEKLNDTNYSNATTQN